MIRIPSKSVISLLVLASVTLPAAFAFLPPQTLKSTTWEKSGLSGNHIQICFDQSIRSCDSRIWLSSDPFATPSVAAAAPKQRKKQLKTFGRYLEVECWKHQEFRELQPVLQAVSDACKQINRIVQRAQTDDLYGVALGPDGNPLEETNVQGEVQQKLDVVCNTIMLRAFCGCSSSIASVASEEENEPRSCADVMNDSAFSVGDYMAVFDPLDGSKNIDASLPVGSIFGIYKTPAGTTVNGEKSFLQNGRNLVAAGYCLFS